MLLPTRKNQEEMFVASVPILHSDELYWTKEQQNNLRGQDLLHDNPIPSYLFIMLTK